MLSTAKPSDKVEQNQQEKLKQRHSTPEAIYAELAVLLMCKTVNYK